MDIDDVSLGFLVPLDAAPQGSRAKDKKQDRKLPAVFFFAGSRSTQLLGACLITDCAKSAATSTDVAWGVCRVVWFDKAIPLTSLGVRYWSRVFELQLPMETQVRLTAATSVGQCINHHFLQHAGSSWRVLSLNDCQIHELRQWHCEAVVLHTDEAIAFALGIDVPIVLRSASSSANGADDLTSATSLRPRSTVGVPIAQVDAGSTMSDLMVTNLKAMSWQTPGNIQHRFRATGILSCLRLASKLKPGVTLDEGLGAAAGLLCGTADVSGVSDALRRGTVPLPSLGVLRQSRIKLEMMAILYERELRKKFRCIRYLLLDSSPQLGFNIHCVREDRIMIPRLEWTSPAERARFDITANYSTRIFHLATLGLGNAGTVKKLLTVVNIQLMESTTYEDFDETRNEVFGTTIDSEMIKDVGDEPVSLVEAYRGTHSVEDPQSRLYPNNLHVPGHLHILFNALESAIKALDESQEFFDALTAIQNVLCNSQLRAKFRAQCLTEMEALSFVHYSTVHIDWRWEFLCKAVVEILARQVAEPRSKCPALSNTPLGVLKTAALRPWLRDLPGRI